jgi:hypothetical protein
MLRMTGAALTLLFSDRPGVKEQDSGGLEISGVPGHDAEAVAKRGGGDESVRSVHNAACFLGGGSEFSPDVAGFKIDRKQTVGVIALKRQ